MSCDDGDCNTEDVYDYDSCTCTHEPIQPPSCDDGDCTTEDFYHPEMCECMHIEVIPPDCDDQICTTIDSYNAATCECVHTNVDPPVCDDNNCLTTDTYDIPSCACLFSAPEPAPDCNDDDCTTADVFNSETCECEHNAIEPMACDDGDCNTADSYDAANCICVHEVIEPTCDDGDCTTTDEYNAATCECEHNPKPIPSCDDEICTTYDTFNAETCSCVHTPIEPPVCDDGDCTTQDVYNETNCMCEYNPIVPPDCSDDDCTTFDYYDTTTCMCIHDAQMEPDCNDDDCTTEDSYDEANCQCVNTPIAPPTCSDDNPCTYDYYDAATCACVYDDDCENDIIPPTITIIDPAIIGLGDGDTLFVECDNMPFLDNESIKVTDCCDMNPNVMFIDSAAYNGICTEDGFYQLFVCGWKVTDASGNMSSYFVNIAITDYTAPEVEFNQNLLDAFNVTEPVENNDTIVTDCNNLPTITGENAADYIDVFDYCGGITVAFLDEYIGTGDCDSEHIYRCSWIVKDRCDNTTIHRFYVKTVCGEPCEEEEDESGIEMGLRVFLQGALIGVDGSGASSTDMMMRDDLRVESMLPTSEPYTALPNFDHIGDGGGETVNTTMFDIVGESAPVDWLMVEIRDASDPSQIIATCSGILCRNGEVVNADGTPMSFANLANGDYYVAVRHRNHLGAMTAQPISLSTNSMAMIDFTEGDTWGAYAQKELADGHYCLWGGDVNGEGRIIFQGVNTDANGVFFDVLSDPMNTTLQTNYIMHGYYSSDIDMNNDIIYQGDNTEVNYLFFNVLSHPANTDVFPNFIVIEQLP